VSDLQDQHTADNAAAQQASARSSRILDRRRTMSGIRLQLPTVARIRTMHGSHIEPPLVESWSDAEKLAWQAAVVSLDSGLTIYVSQFGDLFGIGTGRSSMSAMPYLQTWTLLNGIEMGAKAVRNEEATK
jgi:hypothetical protein